MAQEQDNPAEEVVDSSDLETPIPETDSTDAELVADEDAAVDTAVDDDPAVSEAESIAAAVAAERPVRKSTKGEGSTKGKATPKQRKASSQVKEKRTSPVQFVGESVEELKKVNWPSLDQWKQYFVVVLVFVLVIIAYISLIDVGFGWLVLWAFGG